MKYVRQSTSLLRSSANHQYFGENFLTLLLNFDNVLATRSQFVTSSDEAIAAQILRSQFATSR